ncbi:prephenate dehydratase [Formosa sp. PL04]|uniref:prephenate dehydratase n=1 Tax=Formosa sp. PL04 TaxID=3081755 RepID=UPI0029822AD4|nr:prephenate dehydratase [Formosa sp. PL04]MDW5287464.1 prephenate dehydratase [Formosa sp. PL04]
MAKTVSIQGIKGSFHHIVAKTYFDNDTIIDECMSFDTLVDNLVSKKSDIGIMALENTIAGSILPNYALIDRFNLHVIGECYLDIQHNLMAYPGQKMEDITEVYSHPMALLQCKIFFKDYPHIKLVEDRDTAETAERIKTNQLKGVAAIASKTAAEIFGLEILAESIQTIKENETRFVIVKTQNSVIDESEITKASIRFVVEHKRGSLASVLNVLSDCRMSLTKIQSLPKIETPWKYAFFVDVTFLKYKNFEKAKDILSIMVKEFKVLGEYKNAKL